MQHHEADQTQAPERYILGEMNAVELEQFEEHLFECAECAEAVKTDAIFADNARTVFREEEARARVEGAKSRERSRVPWWNRFIFPVLAPTFAALGLLCVAGYQRLVVIPQLRSQLNQATAFQPLTTFPLHPLSRGEPQVIDVPATARSFSIYFEVASEEGSGYLCQIRDTSGLVVLATDVPQPKPGAMVNLLLGTSKLPAGDYTLVVRTRGPNAQEVGQIQFRVEYKQQ